MNVPICFYPLYLRTKCFYVTSCVVCRGDTCILLSIGQGKPSNSGRYTILVSGPQKLSPLLVPTDCGKPQWILQLGDSLVTILLWLNGRHCAIDPSEIWITVTRVREERTFIPCDRWTLSCQAAVSKMKRVSLVTKLQLAVTSLQDICFIRLHCDCNPVYTRRFYRQGKEITYISFHLTSLLLGTMHHGRRFCEPHY